MYNTFASFSDTLRSKLMRTNTFFGVINNVLTTRTLWPILEIRKFYNQQRSGTNSFSSSSLFCSLEVNFMHEMGDRNTFIEIMMQ